MTLVVAKIIGERIYTFADTKLTHPSIALSGPLEETLKIVPIDAVHCVAYAGLQELAIQIIRELVRLAPMQTDQCVEFLLRKHIESDCSADFLLTHLSPKLGLHKISAGKSVEEIGSSWIGDIEAFSIFQGAFHTHIPAYIPEFDEEFLNQCPHLKPENQLVLNKMIWAFHEVLAQTKTRTVGGFLTRLLGRPMIGYTFEPESQGFDFEPTISTTQEQSILRSKPAEAGGYDYTLLASDTPTSQVVGVWILQNRLGILYHPLQSSRPFLFPGVSCSEFIAVVRSEFHIELTGLLLT